MKSKNVTKIWKIVGIIALTILAIPALILMFKPDVYKEAYVSFASFKVDPVMVCGELTNTRCEETQLQFSTKTAEIYSSTSVRTEETNYRVTVLWFYHLGDKKTVVAQSEFTGLTGDNEFQTTLNKPENDPWLVGLYEVTYEFDGEKDFQQSEIFIISDVDGAEY